MAKTYGITLRDETEEDLKILEIHFTEDIEPFSADVRKALKIISLERLIKLEQESKDEDTYWIVSPEDERYLHLKGHVFPAKTRAGALFFMWDYGSKEKVPVPTDNLKGYLEKDSNTFARCTYLEKLLLLLERVEEGKEKLPSKEELEIAINGCKRRRLVEIMDSFLVDHEKIVVTLVSTLKNLS